MVDSETLIKAYFIAPSFTEANYWAKQLGYIDRKEWKMLNRLEDAQGLRGTELPVYRVGGFIHDMYKFEVMNYLDFIGVKITFPLDERRLNERDNS